MAAYLAAYKHTLHSASDNIHSTSCRIDLPTRQYDEATSTFSAFSQRSPVGRIALHDAAGSTRALSASSFRHQADHRGYRGRGCPCDAVPSLAQTQANIVDRELPERKQWVPKQVRRCAKIHTQNHSAYQGWVTSWAEGKSGRYKWERQGSETAGKRQEKVSDVR